MSKILLSAGVDIGSSAVKVAVVRDAGPDGIELLSAGHERVRRRDAIVVAEEIYDSCLAEAGLMRSELAYVATTGEGDMLPFRTGHFYGMTTHARGALFLDREARSIVDIGALHARAVQFDERGKVLGYRMTSQCASGSGQFLENIGRYLGVTLEEIGPMSEGAEWGEACSSICAVLAETDVINMVSRGIPIPNILKGIHDSMAGRYAKLLSSLNPKGVTLITGGLAADVGLLRSLGECLEKQGLSVELRAHPQSMLAGAIGAAIWGAFRVRKLGDRGLALAGSRS